MLDTVRAGDITMLHSSPDTATYRPVLFVHGYFVDGSIWTNWLERFAAHGVPAFAVNLRGRAGSRPGIDLGSSSIDDFADDASAAAREIGAAAVVGHSMGGLIAQKLAERRDVDAAVLITPAPPRGISVLSPRVAFRQLRYMPAVLRSRLVRPGHEDLRALTMNRVPPSEQKALLDATIPDSGRAGREMSITGVPIDAALVRCPMLVVAGEDDHFIPARIVKRIAQRYGAELDIARDHGHMIIAEPGWAQLADRVEEWLRQHA